MTSQRAPPELKGFGNTTSTPGFTRSSQVLMCFGLPFRSTKTTTDFETIPLYLLPAQPLSTSFDETSRSTSVEIEKLTTSAGRPAATALLCTSEAANEFWNLIPLPGAVAWYAVSSFGKTAVGIEYATTERFVSAERVGAAAAAVLPARAATASRGTERRPLSGTAFPIDVVQFVRLMTGVR